MLVVFEAISIHINFQSLIIYSKGSIILSYLELLLIDYIMRDRAILPTDVNAPLIVQSDPEELKSVIECLSSENVCNLNHETLQVQASLIRLDAQLIESKGITLPTDAKI